MAASSIGIVLGNARSAKKAGPFPGLFRSRRDEGACIETRQRQGY